MRIYYLLSFLLMVSVAFAQEKRETGSVEKFVLNFRMNKTDLDSTYLSNMAVLNTLKTSIKEAKDGLFYMDIEVYSSPDGPIELNDLLATKRAAVIEKYLNDKFKLEKSKFVTIKSLGESWNHLYDMIVTDPLMPKKQEVLELLSDKTLDKTILEVRLRKFNGGIPFAYIRKNFLPRLRSVTFKIEKSRMVAQVDTVAVVPPAVVTSTEPQTEPVESQAVMEVVTPSTTCKRFPVLIKTNLAAYAVAVANLGIEILVGDHLSIDIPFYYSPYTVANDYRFQIIALQPELRYWLNKPLKGHFFGAHLMGGYFNVATNKQDRYQDRNGNTPALGVGLSYGFALPLSKRWGLEFTAGAGYLHLDYDRFYNVENGIKIESSAKHYFGPTKLSVNLIYKIN